MQNGWTMADYSAYQPSLNSLTQRAAKRGIKVRLSLKQYAHLHALQWCFYCCIKLPRRVIRGQWRDIGAAITQGHGLDRIDSHIRYYRWQNVVPCCKDCNTIKSGAMTALRLLQEVALASGSRTALLFAANMTVRKLRQLAGQVRRGEALPPLWHWRALTTKLVLSKAKFVLRTPKPRRKKLRRRRKRA